MDVHQKKLIQINAVLVKLMSVVTDIITDWHDYDFLILSLIFFNPKHQQMVYSFIRFSPTYESGSDRISKYQN